MTCTQYKANEDPMSNGARGELILLVFIQNTCVYIQESTEFKNKPGIAPPGIF